MSCLFSILGFILLGPASLLAATGTETSYNLKEMSYYYLEQTYKTYSNCVIHIVDLKGNLKLPPPPLPVVLDVWTTDLDEIGNLPSRSAEFKSKLESMAEPRLRIKSAMAKIVSFSCFVTLLLVSRFESPSVGGIVSKSNSRMNALQVLLRQDFTLALDTPFILQKGRAISYTSLTAKYFSESVFVLSGLPAPATYDELSLLDLTLFFSSSHLPTIVLISIGPAGQRGGPMKTDESLPRCGTGIFFCWLL